MRSSVVKFICCCALFLSQERIAVTGAESTLSMEETAIFTKRLTEMVSIFKKGELYRVLLMPKFYYPSSLDPFSTGKVQASCNSAGEIPEGEIENFLNLISSPEKLTFYDSIAPITCIPLLKKVGTTPDFVMDMYFIGQKLAIRIKVPNKEQKLIQADFIYSEKVSAWVRSKIYPLDKSDAP